MCVRVRVVDDSGDPRAWLRFDTAEEAVGFWQMLPEGWELEPVCDACYLEHAEEEASVLVRDEEAR